MNISNKNKIIKNASFDMLLNIIATVIPILVLQFILLPIISRYYSDANYGIMITLISLVTLFVQSFGGSLSNTRLLTDNKYKEEGVNGDFNLILIIVTIISIFGIIIGTIYYENTINIINILLIILFSTFQLLRRYFVVAFRLVINYKYILINNIILIIGYLIGMGIFFITKKWQFIYIVGELFALIYVVLKSDLIKEPIKKTKFFKETNKYNLAIIVSSFFGTALVQMDKLILFPLLGPAMVTIYFVSSLFGKTMSLLITPISNVILTYISKMKKFHINYFKIMLFLSIILGIISYFIIILFSRPILGILYPQYVDAAMNLIYITTLTAIITMISSVLNPIIMKFRNINWQIIINVVNFLIYIILAIILVNLYNIIGFCVAALIAALSKLIFIIGIYLIDEIKK